MRIAFFSEAYDPFTNGVVVLIKAYREALLARGHEVVVFCPEHEERPRVEEGVVRLPSLQLKDDWYRLALPFGQALRELRSGQFDILHSHHPFSCGIIAERLARKHDIPLVYTFHTMLTEQSHHVPGPKHLAQRGILRVIRRHCERAHCVTVSTNVMRDWLISKKVNSAIHVVRPDPPKVNVHPGARDAIRSRLGIPSNAVVAFCASRLSAEKDVDILLRALSHIPESVGLRVVIAGSGCEEGSLRDLANSLKVGSRIHWAGEVRHEEIGDYYAAADFFAFPSRNDTLGLVVLEAMVCGLPCVVMDQNGPSEIVRHGIDGLRSAPSEHAFANAMWRLAFDADTRIRLASNAREGVLKFCNPPTADGLLEAYDIAAKMAAADRLVSTKKGKAKPPKKISGPRVW